MAKLQVLFYRILPQSAAVVSYAKGLGKLSAKWQSFDPNTKNFKRTLIF